MGIVTEYPFWFILLCLLAGAVYSFFLYFRARHEDLKTWQVLSMAALRFLSVTILSFLLLSPLLKKSTEIIEKPLILFAQDNSQSVALSKDSAYYRHQYPEEVRKFIGRFGNKFEVGIYSFGEDIRNELTTSFNEKSTDISEIFSEFVSRYSNRNVGAMILASDGIYNKGSNPFYPAQKLPFPVYTIALGDTLLVKDIILKKANYNRTVFLGDKFPVEVEINGDKCDGERSEVTVSRDKQVLQRKLISFSGEQAFRKAGFILEANEKGIIHYTVRVAPVDKEVNLFNNSFEIFVDVRDVRQKIALLYQAPHPDISAFRSAIEATMKYDLTVKKINEFTDQPDKYDLIILYQLPSLKEITSLSRFISSTASLLFIMGSQSDLNSFNNLKAGLQVISQKNIFSESLPSFNPDFALFTSDKEMVEGLKDFPPLFSPFGTYRFSPVSEILFYQKMGYVVSETPLVMFVQNPGKKYGIIAGENIWKWRLTDFNIRGNHHVFNEWINKIVQYLSVREDKSLFRVRCDESYQENENVSLEAELYNESYEMINQPDVNLTITDEQNKSYTFLFGKSEKSYFLNAGTFPVGKYTYSASVKVGKSLFQKTGTFIVNQINLETINLIADHNLLFRLARDRGGVMVFPAGMNDLYDRISSREDVKPVIYTQKRFSDLVGNLWIFLVIIVLVTTEWFLRKRNGIY